MVASKAIRILSLCVGSVVLLVAVLPWAYSFFGPALDRLAKEETEDICGQITIGSSTNTLPEIAKHNKAELIEWEPEGSSARFQFSTSGYLANSATCDIYAESGVIVAKNIEVHRW